MSTTMRAERPLFEGADWEFSTIQRCHEAIEEIAIKEMGLSVYPNQIEIIGTAQPSPHFFSCDSKAVGLDAKSPRHLQREAGPTDRVIPRVT